MKVKHSHLDAGFMEMKLIQKKGLKRVVGTLILGPSSSEIYTQPHRRLRSSVAETVPTILVTTLAIHDTLQGKGLAKLLLIYGLCYFKFQHPHFEYSVLDDTSDHASEIRENVYSQLGYEYVEPTQLSNTERGHLCVSDPCKSLRLDQAFLERALRHRLLEGL